LAIIMENAFHMTTQIRIESAERADVEAATDLDDETDAAKNLKQPTEYSEAASQSLDTRTRPGPNELKAHLYDQEQERVEQRQFDAEPHHWLWHEH
jgi:hypothetical protein